MNYEQMRALYEKMGKNAHLKKLFAKGESPYNREKLEHELGKLGLLEVEEVPQVSTANLPPIEPKKKSTVKPK